MNDPKTLQEAIQYFSDLNNCREYMVALRWPNGVTCPKCGSDNVLFMEKYNRWHCREKHDAPQFTLKTGTVMEESPIPLQKWLPAMWLLVNCKNGVSSYEIHRDLGVTQKTAWFMLQRLRLALQSGSLTKLGGSGNPVEVDETFIGGKARNMHKSRKVRMQKGGRNAGGKTIVMGMLERDGMVRTVVLPDKRERNHMKNVIRANVKFGTNVITDEFAGYYGLSSEYLHEVINHLEGYVVEHVYTNGIENFWSLLKRGLNGTYVAVEPFHLFRYVDEQVFRFNNRKTKDNPLTDADRFTLAVSQIVGKRLTYAQLTGKAGERAAI